LASRDFGIFLGQRRDLLNGGGVHFLRIFALTKEALNGRVHLERLAWALSYYPQEPGKKTPFAATILCAPTF